MKYIFLHGMGQSPLSWEKTIDVMSKRDVVCPDLSHWLHDEKAEYDSLYRALEKYCEQFEENVHLCGLSLGGILALQYAIDHHDKVCSMALIGTQYIMPKGLLRLQNIIFHLMPKSSFRETGLQKGDFISLSKSMMDLNFSQDLYKIECPVLVLCGEKDRANKSASQQLVRLLSNARLSIVANSGHEVNLDNPAALGKELEIFFT